MGENFGQRIAELTAVQLRYNGDDGGTENLLSFDVAAAPRGADFLIKIRDAQQVSALN